MRKAVKKNLLEIFKTIYEAHEIVKGFIDKKEYENAQNLLADCQNTAIQIGNLIEEFEGEGFVTVSFLEEYCEALYEVSINLSVSNGYKVQKQLDKKIIKAENSAKNDIKVKLEIVFMPYKASMWDSLESVWKAADEDPDCDAYVVPIPYYDRKPGGAFGEFHYEGNEYPEYVPVVHYDAYNLEQRRPDAIYIHNPYDGYNSVTSVDPRFYSSELKKYTECLVYVPYFITGGTLSKSFYYIPSYNNFDYIISQSAVINEYIIKEKVIQNKILTLGNPKIDKVLNYKNNVSNNSFEDSKLSKYSSVFFYNTSISNLLNQRIKIIKKIEYIIDTFAAYDDVALIWRPHPLFESTIDSMIPQLKPYYQKVLNKARSINNVFVDLSPNVDDTVNVSDAYIGEESSSIVHMFGVCGKPIFLTNPDIFQNYDSENGNTTMYDIVKINEDFWLPSGDRNCLLKIDKNGNLLEIYEIPDEKCDEPRLYNSILYADDKLFLIPYKAKSIAVFDLCTKEFTKISIKNPVNICFVKAHIYGENMYLIPGCYDSIVQLDIKSLEIKYHKQIVEKFKKNADDIFAFNGSIINGNILYIALAQTNQVITINLDSFQVNDNVIGKTGYWCMEGVEGKFLLGSNSGNSLIYWNSVTEEIKELNLFGDETIYKSGCFYNMVRFGKDVFVFPKLSDKILKINLDTLDIATVELKISNYLDKRKNEYYDWISNCLMAKRIDEHSIAVQCAYDYGIDLISLDKEEHITVKIPESKMPYSMDRLLAKRTENLPWAIRETKICSLSKFIDYVLSENHNKTKQIKEYEYISVNSDGSAGEKIHKEISNRVR